jgi:hypothetical protein
LDNSDFSAGIRVFAWAGFTYMTTASGTRRQKQKNALKVFGFCRYTFGLIIVTTVVNELLDEKFPKRR